MELKAFSFDGPWTQVFIGLAYDLYQQDPAWIPPFRKELLAQLSPTFPFYGRPGNDHRRFLALSGGRPLARCLASVNHDLRDRDGTPIGAIGWFEATDDYAAAEAVLSAAARWLREEHGFRRIWGPLNFDIWNGYRFMTRGFDREPFHGEPYNKPYYSDFFQRFGFVARQRWNALELDASTLAQLATSGAARAREVLANGYRFEPFDLRRFDASVETLHSVLTRSFSRFLGYTPISLPEFRCLMSVARQALHPACSTFVYDPEGALAGFAGVFRDLGPAVRAMRGEQGPLAQLRFLYHRRRVRRLMLHVGGITPEEAAKHSAVAKGVFGHVVGRLRAQGCESVLATLIAQGNPVRRLFGACASDNRREYALYEMNL